MKNRTASNLSQAEENSISQLILFLGLPSGLMANARLHEMVDEFLWSVDFHRALIACAKRAVVVEPVHVLMLVVPVLIFAFQIWTFRRSRGRLIKVVCIATVINVVQMIILSATGVGGILNLDHSWLNGIGTPIALIGVNSFIMARLSARILRIEPTFWYGCRLAAFCWVDAGLTMLVVQFGVVYATLGATGFHIL